MVDLQHTTALCSATLNPSAPEWVHLFPNGKIEGRDGRQFNLSNAADIIQRFDTGAVDLPIDYEHQSEKPQGSGPVPAAGWINALAMREDGLWGRVAWTAMAREMIETKAYRYLSPSFLYDAVTKDIKKLKSAGLVHKPNLELTALASQEDTMADDTNLMTRLATMLQLDATATEDDIMAAMEKMMADGATPDPAKYVPIEAMQDALKDRNDKTASMAQTQVTSRVNDALRQGYISPGMKGWATALCEQDVGSFDAFIATAVPQFAHLHHRLPLDGVPPAVSKHQTASNDLASAVCEQLGLPDGSLSS